MNGDPQGNRFAPPTAHVEDPAAGAGELATRGARFGAAMVDVLVMMLALWLVSIVTPWSPFKPQQSTMLGSLFGFIVFALVQAYPLAARGQTIGKILLDIRIVRSSGERASIGRLLGLRYGVGSLANMVPVFGPLYGVVDALLIFRGSHRCLHDNIADTIVVKA